MSDLRNGSMDADKEREDGVHMNMNTKIEELLAVLKKKEDDKQKNTVLWVLAIIGAVAAVAGIAFAVYRFFAPDYLEDFEEADTLYIETMLEPVIKEKGTSRIIRNGKAILAIKK